MAQPSRWVELFAGAYILRVECYPREDGDIGQGDRYGFGLVRHGGGSVEEDCHRRNFRAPYWGVAEMVETGLRAIGILPEHVDQILDRMRAIYADAA